MLVIKQCTLSKDVGCDVANVRLKDKLSIVGDSMPKSNEYSVSYENQV
jgi:hypothetical protein